MFGSHDHDDDQDNNAVVTSPTVDNSGLGGVGTSDPGFDAPDISLPAPGAGASLEEPTDTPIPSTSPMSDDKPADDTPADDSPANDVPADEPAKTDNDDLLTKNDTDDLVKIKQDALHELTPLVDHLDQSPEEKFRTTMMMIQASDDQSLLQAAYDAAKGINDDKARAQALLDVINEINYFTQQSK